MTKETPRRGAPKVSGFVPNIGSMPKVGAMEGRAFVTVRPISPSLIAMSAVVSCESVVVEFRTAAEPIPCAFAFSIAFSIARYAITGPSRARRLW